MARISLLKAVVTSRLLMLALGPDVFRALLEDFWSRTPPRQYAGTEADGFADYLVARGLRIPQLQSILAFERAALETLRDGEVTADGPTTVAVADTEAATRTFLFH